MKMRMWKVIYTTQFYTSEQYAFTKYALDRVKTLEKCGAKIERVERLPYNIKNFYLCYKRRNFTK